MNLLHITGKDDTPEVVFDGNTGLLKIIGRSFPQNAKKFYDPIFKWVDEYIENAPQDTIVEMKLDYFHSSSQKAIVDILRKLQKLKSLNKNIRATWYYHKNDEDMYEQGKEFEGYVNLPFEYITY